ncbi:oxygen-independent coproporphyrinogen III oxidase [Pseudomonas stutzeri]|uniref:Coproporphyrinogen-III oxidase n=1 Tax=Stutzerimonas stutzeri TaxID=316 RepID=A0A2N8RZB5_STUST|nr:oxygen-independent coproporphyrinogen III oxidase [Stutzerimonas stutzeri]MCQ4297587.1 oxygen-independent coproporphyrinogen III oxidase [Stutzerimonas stutzeri]PNF79719.1 oxygen-independent coproporphyrinogen III oxidase [Stutzerimonas stutzeri]
MLDSIRWDSDLIRRYDQAGPRYSSYPTAAQFNDKIGSFDLLHALRGSRQASRPLSLYVHLPFCANACYYCGRNNVVTSDRKQARAYLERLEREIELIACHLGKDQLVEQLHFGGGTPTFLSHEELRRLMGHLRQHFNLQDDDHGDFSIEIDPREADWPTMGLLRELGFNRISIGVQDLDPDVQRAVNRTQTLEQTRTIIEAARTLQFHSLNIDLLYGLPLQTPARFATTLEAIIDLQPDRLSLFSYDHQPEQFATQRRISAGDLPSPSDKLAMLEQSINQLADAGYRYIGMDHFALPDDELAMAQEDGSLQRNFQGYTTHGHCDLVGLGVSAISQIGDLYCQNSSDVTEYQHQLDQNQLATAKGLRCKQDDQIRRAVIQSLICDFELDLKRIERDYSIDFQDYFCETWPLLEQMAADRLIEIADGHLVIQPVGRLLVRSICMLFDHYLPEHAIRSYSRVL